MLGVTALVGVLVVAGLYALGGVDPDFRSGRSSQGKVIRAEVTIDDGAFEVQLRTLSSVSGEKDWVPEGKTFTRAFSQDVLLEEGERVQFWLTGAAIVQREGGKRTIRCQLYDNGRPLPGRAADGAPVRPGLPGEPVGCYTVAFG